jgi:hypothetical protein
MLTSLVHLEYPAVLDSYLFGSLGAMVVRKDTTGIELFFAHNTDSFVRHVPFGLFVLLLITSYRLSVPCPATERSPSV